MYPTIQTQTPSLASLAAPDLTRESQKLRIIVQVRCDAPPHGPRISQRIPPFRFQARREQATNQPHV